MLLLSSVSVFTQNLNKEVEADILVQDPKEDVVFYSASVKNLTGGNYSLTYQFSVLKKNKQEEIDKETQEGRFTLTPFESKNLFKSQLVVSDTIENILLLLIFNEDKLISTHKAEVNFKKELPQESYNKMNEGLMISGIVAEDTKTKAGKDFYDFFYQKYHMSSLKTNKIIKVEEAISFGRTTRIQLKIENQIVYQFFAQPKLDYIKTQAEYAMTYLNRYLQQLEQSKVSSTQY